MEGSLPVIFVSYAREDEDRARDIVRAMTKLGYGVWFDKDSLLPGQKWKPTIERAIRRASVFLAVLSHRAVSKRGFVQRELKAALEVLEEIPEDEIFVIPVRLDDCKVTDSRLRELHYVDLFPDFESGIEKVVAAMEAARVPLSHVTDLLDVPRISLFSVEPTHIFNGGEVRIVVQAESVSPVVWLNRSFDGPRGNIYGGGAGSVFSKMGRDLWEISWVEAMSRWAPSGVYRLSKVSVRNEREQTSGDAEPKSFTVENEAHSKEPIIESIVLSSYRVAAGDSLRVTVRAKSEAPVNWLNRMLTGPVRIVYGGGAGTHFSKEQSDTWVYTWVEKFSTWTPPGQYVFSGISVQSEAQLESEQWPDIHFEVVKVKT